MPQVSRRGVRACCDSGLSYDPFDELPSTAVRERPARVARSRLQGRALGGARRRARLWHRDFTEYDSVCALLERPDRDEPGVTLDRTRRERQRLGYPAAGIGQRQAQCSKVSARIRIGSFKEASTLGMRSMLGTFDVSRILWRSAAKEGPPTNEAGTSRQTTPPGRTWPPTPQRPATAGRPRSTSVRAMHVHGAGCAPSRYTNRSVILALGHNPNER